MNNLKYFGTPLYALHTEDSALFNNDSVIHTGAYFCKCNVDKSKNLLGKNPTFFNMKYDCSTLLSESVNFGKKLYDCFNGDFFVDFKKTSFHDVTLYDEEHLEYPPIETSLDSIETLFMEWFETVGFPYSNATNLKNRKVYVSLKKITDLRNKYIILYLMHTIFCNLNNLIDGISNCDTNSEYDDRRIEKSQNVINSIINNLGITNANIKIDYYNPNNSIKKLQELKSRFIFRLQNFSDYFRIQTTPYIVFKESSLNDNYIENTKSKIITTSENIFDLAWDILIKTVILNKKFENICFCECGRTFIKKHGKNTKCQICRENDQKNRSKNENTERKELIKEICSFKDTLIIRNTTAKEYLNIVLDLTTYGNSTKKSSFSITTLKQYKKYILEHSKTKKGCN